MAPDPPAPTSGTPGDEGFEALEQRAAAAAERGAARQRDLAGASAEATDPPGPRRARTLGVVALVALLLLAGGVIGWTIRGGSTNDDTSRLPTSTPTLPTTTSADSPSPSTAPPTTVPTTVTSTSTPAPPSAVATPPPDAPDPTIAPDAPVQHTVVEGESFWTIAKAEVARVSQQDPDLSEVDGYWRSLVRANSDRLVQPGDADLLHPGQVLLLPAVPGST